MYSDTHFHFEQLQKRLNSNASDVITTLLSNDCFFALDIGTECDDLISRSKALNNALLPLSNELQEKAKKMLFVSAGIWPSSDAIQNRFEQMQVLRKCISKSIPLDIDIPLVAIGECGLDHFHNKEKNTLSAECELFEMQLSLAKELNLPIIIHTRDAFEDTLSCIKNIGYDRGIIHCYSYGKVQAQKFFERGWYISFSGAITYAKKSNLEETHELLRSIPKDKILIETDSPFLSPVPFRGKINTPVNVKYVYDFVANALEIESEVLSEIVDNNCKQLFLG